MVDPRIAKWCRFAGKAIIIGAVLFLIWSIIDVQAQRSKKPPYYDPENDLPRIAGNYFVVMGGVGAGCVLLWLGSFLRPKSK